MNTRWKTAALLGLTVAIALNGPLPDSDSLRHGRVLERVLDLVEVGYYEEVDRETVFYDGLDAMLRRLDPNSRFIAPVKTVDFTGDTEGFIVGIGVVLETSDAGVVIQSVIPNGPAAKAGLESGDLLVGIAGERLDAPNIAPWSERLRGPENSTVTLEVRRSEEERRFDVVRRRIPVPSIAAIRRFGASEGSADPSLPIGYVRVEQFQNRTAADLHDALASLRRAGCRAFAIDLRNNRGGILDEAVAVCDLFLSSKVVLRTRGRANADRPFEHRTRAETPFENARVAVLIDGGSASASEIVAAALQDHGVALVVGEASYGKWTVQDVIPLDGGGLVKLTTKRFDPPFGHWLHAGRDDRPRLHPQLEVPVDANLASDRRFAFETERLERLPDPSAIDDHPLPKIDDEGADPALVRAVSVLRSPEDFAKHLAVEPPSRESRP